MINELTINKFIFLIELEYAFGRFLQKGRNDGAFLEIFHRLVGICNPHQTMEYSFYLFDSARFNFK
jgi:hypothetical protein